jgi:hypothetical protein
MKPYLAKFYDRYNRGLNASFEFEEVSLEDAIGYALLFCTPEDWMIVGEE